MSKCKKQQVTIPLEEGSGEQREPHGIGANCENALSLHNSLVASKGDMPKMVNAFKRAKGIRAPYPQKLSGWVTAAVLYYTGVGGFAIPHMLDGKLVMAWLEGPATPKKAREMLDVLCEHPVESTRLHWEIARKKFFPEVSTIAEGLASLSKGQQKSVLAGMLADMSAEEVKALLA